MVPIGAADGMESEPKAAKPERDDAIAFSQDALIFCWCQAQALWCPKPVSVLAVQ